ncbi:hypothetical protein AGLY_015486 [Aphis glycines]|uniref:Uncharacterized protein n=1 Tax=Aphis glycines TaxID=307491 RepID=A0A6G0T2H3_APHGL|nr:hypothetical protein AGLY_015486 [Aphis glycines]
MIHMATNVQQSVGHNLGNDYVYDSEEKYDDDLLVQPSLCETQNIDIICQYIIILANRVNTQKKRKNDSKEQIQNLLNDVQFKSLIETTMNICTETPDGFRTSTDLFIPKKYYKELPMPKIMSTLVVKLQQLKCKDYLELHTIVLTIYSINRLNYKFVRTISKSGKFLLLTLKCFFDRNYLATLFIKIALANSTGQGRLCLVNFSLVFYKK